MEKKEKRWVPLGEGWMRRRDLEREQQNRVQRAVDGLNGAQRK